MSKDYSFPIFQSHIILDSMKKMNFEISSKTLSEPTMEDAVRILEFFVEYLMDIDLPEGINTTNQEAFSYPELHNLSIRKIHFLRGLSALMPVVGIMEFNVFSDVINPTPKRFKEILSACINYFRFKEKMKENYTSYTQETDALAENYENCWQKNVELSKELDLIVEQNKQNEPHILNLEKECSNLSETLISLNHQYNQQRELAVEKKNNFLEEKEQFKSLQKQLQKERQDCETIRAQIVPDPEKILTTFEEMRVSLEMKEKSISSSQTRAHQLSTKITSLKEISREIDKCNELMLESLSIKENFERKEEEYSSHSNKKNNLDKEMQNLHTKEQHLQRQISMISEKLNKLPSTTESKIETSKKELAFYCEEERKLQKEELPLKYQKIRSEQEIAERLQQEIEEICQDHQIYIRNIHSNFNVLQQSVRSYHQKLFESIERV